MKDALSSPALTEIKLAEAQKQFMIGSWTVADASRMYEKLEHPNWAPWLEASSETLAGRSLVFPAGQIVVKDLAGNYVGSLSMNQVNWDGNLAHLPTWDAVAGDPTDYSTTYQAHGNTLVLMSMNVAPEFKGQKVPSFIIDHATQVAKQLGVEHFLGSFRPSGFGTAKMGMGHKLDFEEYCLMKKTNSDQPFDPWLRSLWWKGMQMLAVDPQAMTVKVDLQTFAGYQANYQPEMWKEVEPGVWECGEVGSWTVDSKLGEATYVESNVWGKLPLIK